MARVRLAFTDLGVDVISLIFEEFILDVDAIVLPRNQFVEGRSTLRSLALTSKIFLEPALNALWQRITDLGPLLQVLPEATQAGGVSMLLGEVHPSSWKRLLYYTSRVRAFVQWCSGQTRIHSSVYVRLGEAHETIFPRLRRFGPGVQLMRSGSIGFLIPKTLLSLRIISDFDDPEPDDDSDFGPFLSIVAPDITNLEKLELDNAQGARFSGLSWSFNYFRRLRILRIRGTLAQYEQDLVQSICTLQELSELSIEIPPSASLNIDTVQTGFSSLQSLDLQASFSYAASFLKIIDSTTLSMVKYTYCGSSVPLIPSPSSIGDLALVTKALARFNGLKQLRLINGSGSSLLGDASAQWSSFVPLLQLHTLLILSYDFPASIPEDHVASVASAFPKLTSLQITPIGDEEYFQPGIPINSLTHFAHHCRNLRELCLPICIHPLPQELPPPTLFMHPLSYLTVESLDTVDDPFAVALRLDQVFPALQDVSGGGSSDSWRQVNHIIKHGLQFLRAQKQTPGYAKVIPSLQES